MEEAGVAALSVGMLVAAVRLVQDDPCLKPARLVAACQYAKQRRPAVNLQQVRWHFSMVSYNKFQQSLHRGVPANSSYAPWGPICSRALGLHARRCSWLDACGCAVQVADAAARWDAYEVLSALCNQPGLEIAWPKNAMLEAVRGHASVEQMLALHAAGCPWNASVVKAIIEDGTPGGWYNDRVCDSSELLRLVKGALGSDAGLDCFVAGTLEAAVWAGWSAEDVLLVAAGCK